MWWLEERDMEREAYRAPGSLSFIRKLAWHPTVTPELDARSLWGSVRLSHPNVEV